jgi:hypothetical protein
MNDKISITVSEAIANSGSDAMLANLVRHRLANRPAITGPLKPIGLDPDYRVTVQGSMTIEGMPRP